MQECQYESDKRGLASPGFSKDGGTSAWAEIERQMAEDRFYGIVIGIGNIVQAHTTGRGHDNTRALLLLRRLLQFHESLGSRKHANEGWRQPSKVACRALNTID